jgi:cytosine/adenosine deaminase-related metal-dependent hydrolase
MARRRLAARWILPVGSAPIERGALLIGSSGRIEAVGSEAAVPTPPGVQVLEFPDSVIVPGLINTHTHLELTGFEHGVAEPDFATWIRRLRELKATRQYPEYLAAARQGIEDCYAAGITTVADTGDSGAAIQALAECGGSGLAYQEVFGPHPDQAQGSLDELRSRVARLRAYTGNRLRIGVSPHAPYTVSGPLYRAVAGWAGSERLPLAVHVAESAAESQFLRHGTGPFAEAWAARGIPMPASEGHTPVSWLAEHGVLSPETLCIHAVQLSEADVWCLARSGASVAHCPVSNRAHGHRKAPLERLLEAGIRVGIGTDSVVSVGTIDMMAEARAARALAPSLAAQDVLELCTLGGARALGLDSEIGSLEPGKWADCTVVRVPPDKITDPAEGVLATGRSDVRRTLLGGKEVYRPV